MEDYDAQEAKNSFPATVSNYIAIRRLLANHHVNAGIGHKLESNRDIEGFVAFTSVQLLRSRAYRPCGTGLTFRRQG